MAAIDALTAEHRMIERMLSALEQLARRLDGDQPVQLLTELTDILEGYADALHHLKEERRLFEIVIERGFDAAGDGVRALIHQHDTGRTQLQDLRRELQRLKQGDQTALAACEISAREYAEFLREHIRVEDEDVYPLIAKAMSAEEDDALAMYFAEVDDAQHAADLLARFERLLVRCEALDDPHGTTLLKETT